MLQIVEIVSLSGSRQGVGKIADSLAQVIRNAHIDSLGRRHSELEVLASTFAVSWRVLKRQRLAGFMKKHECVCLTGVQQQKSKRVTRAGSC